MKYEQMEITHACGCRWTNMYPKGTTKRELRLRRERAAREICANCEIKSGEGKP